MHCSFILTETVETIAAIKHKVSNSSSAFQHLFNGFCLSGGRFCVCVCGWGGSQQCKDMQLCKTDSKITMKKKKKYSMCPTKNLGAVAVATDFTQKNSELKT